MGCLIVPDICQVVIAEHVDLVPRRGSDDRGKLTPTTAKYRLNRITMQLQANISVLHAYSKWTLANGHTYSRELAFEHLQNAMRTLEREELHARYLEKQLQNMTEEVSTTKILHGAHTN